MPDVPSGDLGNKLFLNYNIQVREWNGNCETKEVRNSFPIKNKRQPGTTNSWQNLNQHSGTGCFHSSVKVCLLLPFSFTPSLTVCLVLSLSFPWHPLSPSPSPFVFLFLFSSTPHRGNPSCWITQWKGILTLHHSKMGESGFLCHLIFVSLITREWKTKQNKCA